MNLYRYVTEDNRVKKQNYMYSSYHGIDFIKEYRSVRLQSIDKIKGYILKNSSCDAPVQQDLFFSMKGDIYRSENENNNIIFLLEEVIAQIQENGFSSLSKKFIDRINLLIKSFEVRKRIYDRYDNSFVPVNGANFLDVLPYALFGFLLGLICMETMNLKYLNTYLKVNDTLISIIEKMDLHHLKLAHYSLCTEVLVVDKLLEQKNIGIKGL